MSGVAFDRLALLLGGGGLALVLALVLVLGLDPWLAMGVVPGTVQIATVPLAAKVGLLLMANVWVAVYAGWLGPEGLLSVAAIHNLILAYILFDREDTRLLAAVLVAQGGAAVLTLLLPWGEQVQGLQAAKVQPVSQVVVLLAVTVALAGALLHSRLTRGEAEARERLVAWC